MTDFTHIPAWVDMERLCHETCLSDRTVDAWVREGRLPAPKVRGRKLMWRWKEVDAYLERGGPEVRKSANPTPDEIADAVRKDLAAQDS